MHIEKIELTHATIRDNICGVAVRGLVFGKKCAFSGLSSFLSEFKSNSVPLDEVIHVSDTGAGTNDVFVSFAQTHLDVVHVYLVKRLSQAECDYFVENNLVEIRIMGSGFARSHEFLQNIYHEISAMNINILAQMCSDIEVIVFCSKIEKERSIHQAMNNIGLKYVWKD